MEEYMSSKKNQKEQMNMGSEYVNKDLFGLEDEDIGDEINSRTNVTNISSGGSNQEGSGGRTFSSKKTKTKRSYGSFFSLLMQRWLFKIQKGSMQYSSLVNHYN